MNNNLQFILRHHPYRASAKRCGTIKKNYQLADIHKVLYHPSAGVCIWPSPLSFFAGTLYGRAP